jgi:hypothetical protein
MAILFLTAGGFLLTAGGLLDVTCLDVAVSLFQWVII